MSFLKTVPAVIGIAGLLTYFMRARAPVSDHELVLVVQRVRNTFLLLGCAALIMLSAWLIFRPAPPDHDAALPMPTTIGNAGTPAKALVRSDGVVLDRFNRARVIISPARHIGPFRYRPHAQNVIWRRPQQLDAAFPVSQASRS